MNYGTGARRFVGAGLVPAQFGRPQGPSLRDDSRQTLKSLKIFGDSTHAARIRLAALTLAILALTASPVLAHASLVHSVPAAGETVSPGLTQIALTFDEPVSGNSTVTLYADGFTPVPGVAVAADGDTLQATLAAPLTPGTYTVQWTALSADGHTSTGSYQFALAGTSPRLPWGGALAAAVGPGFLAALLVWRRRAHTL